jgi:hypothetical protein
MKSSRRTDEDLIKRARYGGRNVTALAILVSIFAVLMLPALYFAPEAGLEWAALTFGLVAAAYWMLAVVTRQGETLGLTIILWLMGIQLLLSVAGLMLTYANHGKTTGMEIWGVIIPLLIFVALAGNRSDLLELHRRGLGESLYGPGRPPRSLAVMGGVVLIGGQIALLAALLVPAVNAARTAKETSDFRSMLAVEDQALLQIISNQDQPADRRLWGKALDATELLRVKAQQVEAQATEGTRIKPIAVKYLQAVERVRTGLGDALTAGQMTPQAGALIQEGFNLRDEAVADYQRQYPGFGPRLK